MGVACNIHVREEKFIKQLIRKPKGRDHIGNLGVDGKEILRIYVREDVGILSEFI